MANYREGLTKERKWRFEDRATILKKLSKKKTVKAFNQALKVYSDHSEEISKINRILKESPEDGGWVNESN